MALIETLTLSANGRVFIKAKNARDGQTARYSFLADGDFGSGTIAVQVSGDGTTWISDINDAGGLTFSADKAGNVDVESAENTPVHIGFNLTGATAPDITIRVYNNK